MSAFGGKVRNGDRVVIDADTRRIDLDVLADELARRPAQGGAFPVEAKGYLGIYRRDVQPMTTGAVLTDLDT
jgi:dihydroxy-acid dehydratase